MKKGTISGAAVLNRPRKKLPLPLPFTWAEGIRGMMDDKGLREEDWNDKSEWKIM
jgi:hypothetical protein